MKIGSHLTSIRKCPYCGVANPTLTRLWLSGTALPRGDAGARSRWAAFGCATCGHVVLAKGKPLAPGVADHENPEIIAVIPSSREAPAELPNVARTFLQQAYDTLHAPDASGVMAASAIDAMLKEVGFTTGSLYARIDKAVEDHVLTAGMGQWAHRVRLEANSVRHADEERPHLTPDEAKQCVEFAEALAQFLFVLAARVQEGIEAATDGGNS